MKKVFLALSRHSLPSEVKQEEACAREHTKRVCGATPAILSPIKSGDTVEGVSSFYLIADQQVYDETGVFFQFGTAPDDISVASMYVGAGVSVTGLVPFRDEDTLGIAFAYAKDEQRPRRNG